MTSTARSMHEGGARVLHEPVPSFGPAQCGRGCRRVPIDNSASSFSIIPPADRRPQDDRAYAAVEPCRRQRPERSEDAAREQAAEGRPANGVRPGKKTDETASDMTRDLNC